MKCSKRTRAVFILMLALSLFLLGRGMAAPRRPVASATAQVAVLLLDDLPQPCVNWNG